MLAPVTVNSKIFLGFKWQYNFSTVTEDCSMQVLYREKILVTV